MSPEFAELFETFQRILKPYEKGKKVLRNKPNEYTLICEKPGPNGKPLYFAFVRAGKAYVSFHLMPLYFNPTLNAMVPPLLKKRMQGKTCFNFTKMDPERFKELAMLTKAGTEHWKKIGYL